MTHLDLFNPLKLPNGLLLSIFDQTRAYFGDYHLVKLEIILSLDDVDDRKLSGVDSDVLRKINYSRSLERMGVHSSDVERVKNTLLKDLEVNSLPYMSSSEFLQRLLDREISANKTPLRKFMGTVS